MGHNGDHTPGYFCLEGFAVTATPGRRILVVDDNVDAAASLTLVLRAGGHEVRMAHDGPAALLEAQAFRPEFVFLDLGLPKMNGYEVAKNLRAGNPRDGLTLIALTGYGADDVQQRTREAGFDHHLVKPVGPDVIERLIAQIGG
jgi:CheY-like chemotaxis protein